MQTFKRFCLQAALLAAFTFQLVDLHAQTTQTIVVDAAAEAHPFPHYWEQMFGSGRAILSLRESYRNDLRDVKKITGLQYVRFHAIFHDEVGVYSEDKNGQPIYNFSYVDQIYDGLLDNGVKPFVELSFMPKELAAKPALHPFWYKQNVAPPKDWQKWDDLIFAFTKHLVDRYGIDEVASWYFEVWNEPNIDFWAGEPKQETYWELYDHTARAVKKVNSRLRVGGPATAAAAWVDAFIKHCADNNVPVDFVSSHAYGNDSSKDIFGTDEVISQDKMVCRAVEKVHNQVRTSAKPDLPLFWTEFNASYMNDPAVTDSIYMGPWMANTIRLCDGLSAMMSYWSFSDVFEEQGVVKKPFYGGYGLMAAGNIPKPAFQAFQMLHKLGDQRLSLNTDTALLTRRGDSSLVLALWNYAAPGETGSPESFILQFRNKKIRRATIWRLDAQHGDALGEYERMGSPRYPSKAELAKLRAVDLSSTPETVDIKNAQMTLNIPGKGLVVIELQ
jgi:xylan 1,4-beta-xylosidase